MEDPLDWASDGEDDLLYDSEEDGDILYESEEDDWCENDKNNEQSGYEILSQGYIQQRQEDVVSTVTRILPFSRPEAVVLLQNLDWRVSNVLEEWAADDYGIREFVGLVQSHPQQEEERRSLPDMTCGICYESHNLERMKSAASCRHFFCDTCWTSYIHTSIEEGPDCLTLRCADPSCSAAIMEDMVLSLVSQKDGAKYAKFRLRAFVESRITAKWCPGPGCEYVVDRKHRAESLSILCKCSHKFCWNCLQEAHRPADCETVAKWVLRSGSESENLTWILENSKACPKCQRRIEKNEGCIHMTCQAPCRFEFCWFCLGDWTSHDERIDDCNNDAALKQGQLDAAQERRNMANDYSYTHFYERWVATESSGTKALEVLQHVQSMIVDKQCQTKSELEFLNKAWLQIVECLQVLKWTYAHRYYQPDHDQMLEYSQEAEALLERLQECAQKEVQQFLDGQETQTSLSEDRIKLVKLTTLAEEHFEHFVQYVENGRA